MVNLNCIYMLSYAFQGLNEQGYKNIATEQFNNTGELMAAILEKGIAIQLKRGLGKEYIPQVQFDKHTLHSGNLYQIFTYVKNKEYEMREKDHTVSGMLLYAKTDEEIYPNNVYQMSGNQITVRTLDLNLPFDEIAGQLNTIAKTHFDL